jgi:ferrous iron transport protein B
VALVGNPNTGKTTVWNALTGNHARVGNYPGVTVERRVGVMAIPEGDGVDLLDVPGTYSLVARTGEEQIAIEAVLGLQGQPRPELVVVCVDATNLERSLYLVLQFLEFGMRVVVALTMVDEAGVSAPDPEKLSTRLGCKVVPLAAHRRQGLDGLRDAIATALKADVPPPSWRWSPSPTLRAKLDVITAALPEQWPRNDATALWALMSVGAEDELVGIPLALRAAVAIDDEAARPLDDEAIIGRYRWLDTEIHPLVANPPDRRRTERIDRLLIHPVSGLLVFAVLMFAIFQALFLGADPIITAIEDVFAWVGDGVRSVLPVSMVTDFIVDGLIAGVGAVVVFLPQILMLFFFLGLLESSGYMARIAFLMDRLMRTMNLHGRAFIPMLSGFACAVPAIMATRTMERKRDRILTMMVIPLTTCSARLPIYTLLIASLIPATHLGGWLPVQGLMMVGMYGFSIVSTLAVAWVLSRTVRPLRAKRLPFVIELPPYRLPIFGDVVRMMLRRAGSFLTDAGRIIVVGSVVLWALLYFPRPSPEALSSWRTEQAAHHAGASDDVAALERGYRLEQSYAGRLGQAMEPVLSPLGFDWKIGVGIIGAFAAREVFVATMGVVYGIGGDVDEETPRLRDKIRAERHRDGSVVYTPLVGITLMIFFALACQCMSTLAAVRRETRSLAWPTFLFGYMTILAWVVSFAVYQGGRMLGLG